MPGKERKFGRFEALSSRNPIVAPKVVEDEGGRGVVLESPVVVPSGEATAPAGLAGGEVGAAAAPSVPPAETPGVRTVRKRRGGECRARGNGGVADSYARISGNLWTLVNMERVRVGRESGRRLSMGEYLFEAVVFYIRKNSRESYDLYKSMDLL
jgi:hypothetical protein